MKKKVDKKLNIIQPNQIFDLEKVIANWKSENNLQWNNEVRKFQYLTETPKYWFIYIGRAYLIKVKKPLIKNKRPVIKKWVKINSKAKAVTFIVENPFECQID